MPSTAQQAEITTTSEPVVLPARTPRSATRVLTGLTPSGRLHIGNYVGALRPLAELAADPANRILVFVADLHALTTPHDPALLRERTRELAATVLACGLPDRVTLFVQSAVPAHAELGLLLESTAGYGEMTRMIQFREKSAATGQESVRVSLLTYPALMAADILVHRADAVPVGQDQRQHLELTRALAERFNARYGEVFTVPEGIVPPAGARVRDLRDPAAKMGKSKAAAGRDSGVVHILDAPVRIAAAVRRAVTDLDPVLSYDPDLRPGIANLAELLGALTGRTPAAALRGLHGAGSLKAEVTQALIETLRPIQDRYREITADPATLDDLLADGARVARESAAPTLAAARVALGLT